MWSLLLLTLLNIVVAEKLIIKRPDYRNTASVNVGNTSIDHYPFIVQIIYNAEGFKDLCSGVLLTNRQLISVAHCIDGNGPEIVARAAFEYTVRVGTSRYNKGGSKHEVSAMIKHPKYDSNTLQNNLCMVLLTTPVVYSHKVKPAYLPPQGYVLLDDSQVTVAGWGVIHPKLQEMVSSETLKHVNFKTVKIDECTSIYKHFGTTVTKDMICAGNTDVAGKGTGKDNCYGDAGGPLVFGGVVVGLVSFSIGCADGMPGVSTRLSAYTNWIEGMIETGNLLISVEMNTENHSTRWQVSFVPLTICLVCAAKAAYI